MRKTPAVRGNLNFIADEWMDAFWAYWQGARAKTELYRDKHETSLSKRFSLFICTTISSRKPTLSFKSRYYSTLGILFWCFCWNTTREILLPPIRLPFAPDVSFSKPVCAHISRTASFARCAKIENRNEITIWRRLQQQQRNGGVQCRIYLKRRELISIPHNPVVATVIGVLHDKVSASKRRQRLHHISLV